MTVTITAERMAKLAEKCEELMSVERVPKQQLRRLAGLATWIAGVMPQISAFTAMLWAAISSTTESSVAQAQAARALKWMRTLCQLNMRPVERHCRRRAEYFALVTFDGSLTGGGATLQIGLKDLQEAESAPVVMFWHTRWTDDDLRKVEV